MQVITLQQNQGYKVHLQEPLNMDKPYMVRQIIKFSDGTETIINYKKNINMETNEVEIVEEVGGESEVVAEVVEETAPVVEEEVVAESVEEGA